MKRCSGCKRTLPLSSFGPNAARKDGLAPECRECRKSYCRGFLSVDKPIRGTDGLCVIDTIAAPVQTPDESWQRVVEVMWRNVDAGVLTVDQMAAVFMHVVEGWNFAEIGREAGVHHTTVMYHYRRGLERLRSAYVGGDAS